METRINGTSNVYVQPINYPDADVEKCECKKPEAQKKESETQIATQRVKQEFIKLVQNGVSPREAFFDSIKAMDKKDDGDVFQCEKCMIGSAKNISPETIRPWLELIAFAIPIIKSVLDLLPKKPAETPEPQALNLISED